MASIKLTGDTSGVITVSAPAVSGTNTITMPASTGTMALTSDITTEIPSQTGNSGKYLTTNGSASSWGTVASGGMDLISTVNTTSGTSHSTGTINLTGYKQLFMSFYSIGSSGTAGQLQMTPNGGSANILFPVSSGSSSQAQYTLVTHDLGSGVMTAPTRVAMARNLTVHTAEGPGGIGINTGLTASTTSIVFAYNGGETFDVGQILIYGLK